MQFEGVKFSLSKRYLDTYRTRIVDWGPFGEFVFLRTYSRKLEDGSQEAWWQTVRRVVEGVYLIQKKHCLRYGLPWNERQAQNSAQKMYGLIFDFKFLPPGRGLWAMGTDFVFRTGAAALNNCAFISTKNLADDFAHPFVWTMDMSMYGVGVGFDTEGAFGKAVFLKAPARSAEVFVVSDSREGWVDAFRVLLEAYAGKRPLPMGFDFSEIRPEGSPINTFGGIAPGPDPLQKLIARTKALLDRYVDQQKQVDSTLIVDLMNFAGAAVVAGGVRRSAELALGRADDTDFAALKSGDVARSEEFARWVSNNSVSVYGHVDYDSLAARSAENGEPGYFWIENAQQYGRFVDGPDNKDYRVAGGNPCMEQTLESYELCCLVETLPSRHENLKEYLETLKYAYLYAKTVTLLPTHSPQTNAVMLRNRRIGLSQTGVTENIAKIGFRPHMIWCDEGYRKVREWDVIYSDWLCIPRSIKVTTVKPSGTVSTLPNVTPGIHYAHSEYYFRRVRVAKTSDVWRRYQAAGYDVEPDVYETDNTMVVTFAVHEKNFRRGKDEVSMWEQLELAAQMQYYWSDNAVSITVTVKPEEAKELSRALEMYESRLKAVSFLPLRGDKIYAQPVYEAICREQYEAYCAKLSPVSLLDAVVETQEEKFCDGDSCLLPGA